MQILCDTNLLVRSIKLDDPHCSTAQNSIKTLLMQGHEPVLVPQCLYEYYVVATRPIAANGLGRTSSDTILDIERLQGAFTVLRDERLVFDRWCDLIKKHPTTGKQAHDARLVAAMIRHSVSYLLTFNSSDFQRFNGVTVITPATLITSGGIL